MKVVLKISLIFTCLMVILLSMSALENENDYDYTVALDGSGDFESIQDAVDASKSFPDDRVTIFIKNGVYEEKVKVHSWNTKLSLIGEDKEETIIRWDDYFDKIDRGRNSTFHTYTVLIQGNDFHTENLTIENSAGDLGQAIALSVEADRVSIVDCRLLGNQDTVYISGEGARQYFKNCYIEGTTDFIFGGATAFFEDCIIHSKKDSYITAASTPEGQSFGMVFKDCRLTSDTDVNEVYLGRPWRDFAKTVFLNTHMAGHVLPEGWHNWDKPKAEENSFYAEYENSGEGFKPGERAEWSHQLTDEQAKMYTFKQIFRDWDPEIPDR